MNVKVLMLFIFTLCCTEILAQTTFSMTKENNRYTCKGESECILDNKNTYGSAILWALDNAYQDPNKNTYPEFNTDLFALKMKGVIKNEEKEYIYTFNLHINIEEKKIRFLVDDIRCIPQKGVFAAMKVITFDKLNLEKKPQNKMFIDEFNTLCNNYIEQTANHILNIDIALNHWDAITKGEVVKGMMPYEVKISKGKPLNISENSQRIVWTYDSGTVVMFEDGIVTGIVN